MSSQAAVTHLRIGSAKYACTNESKLKEGIPPHSDELPRLGKQAAIFLNHSDIMVMTGTAQEHLEHKTIANHLITRAKLDRYPAVNSHLQNSVEELLPVVKQGLPVYIQANSISQTRTTSAAASYGEGQTNGDCNTPGAEYGCPFG